MFRSRQNISTERTCHFSLDILSSRTLVTLAVLCFITFIALLCLIVYLSKPHMSCGCQGEYHQKKERQVNMSGVYLLDEVENYGEYLLAMDIPERAVRNIEHMKSETITVQMLDQEKRVKIITDTAWASKEIQFVFGVKFSVEYGGQDSGGVLEYECHRPDHNIINCRPSISCGGKLGTRFRNMLALPFTRRIAILWLKCRMASDSSWPVCLARADPNLLTKDTVWLCQPPSVSTGRGRKTIPASLHASPCFVIFSPYLLARAWPGVVAAPLTSADWRGLTTVISRAVSLPADQLGMRTSAGLASDPGMRALSSLLGPKQA